MDGSRKRNERQRWCWCGAPERHIRKNIFLLFFFFLLQKYLSLSGWGVAINGSKTWTTIFQMNGRAYFVSHSSKTKVFLYKMDVLVISLLTIEYCFEPTGKINKSRHLQNNNNNNNQITERRRRRKTSQPEKGLGYREKEKKKRAERGLGEPKKEEDHKNSNETRRKEKNKYKIA